MTAPVAQYRRLAGKPSCGNDRPECEMAKDCPIESVSRNSIGQLIVRVKGREEPYVEVKIARCFPWSLPETHISVRDKEGKEIALLKSLGELDDASKAVVLQELEQKVFAPRILRVVDCKEEFGIASLTVETDRGPVTFQVRSRDDVRVLSPTRALFRDADGNTYELADLNALDAAGRRWMQGYF